jgi:hypothetical protein
LSKLEPSFSQIKVCSYTNILGKNKYSMWIKQGWNSTKQNIFQKLSLPQDYVRANYITSDDVSAYKNPPNSSTFCCNLNMLPKVGFKALSGRISPADRILCTTLWYRLEKGFVIDLWETWSIGVMTRHSITLLIHNTLLVIAKLHYLT